MIAESAGVSPNYLSGIFTKEAGMPLRDYVTHVRMEEAKALLLTTELRTYQVAGAVGIEDVKYFGKLFKQHTGQSPQDFRKHI
jgi:two-component system response regulator YesN